MVRTPVFFLSHGGPSLFEDNDHPAFAKLQEIGREITTNVKPKAVIVFSAHWQGEPDTIKVNIGTYQPLLYDFYGFPSHYYDLKYPNSGSPELAGQILNLLNNAGLKAEGVERGLDHGAYSLFTVAFNPKTNPLNVPIVQVSLFDNEDPHRHYALGKALSTLRDEGVLIIASGTAVHNLRDFRRARGAPGALPYVYDFDAALKQAAEQPEKEREEALAGLLKRNDARQAHPSFEHLLPVHIAAGAAADDTGKQLWTLATGSLSWAMFRFGDVQAAA